MRRFFMIALFAPGSILLASCRESSLREAPTALPPAACYRLGVVGETPMMPPGRYVAPYPDLFGLSQEPVPLAVAGVHESELHYLAAPVPRDGGEPGYGFWYRMRDSVAVHWRRYEAAFVMMVAQQGDTLAGRGNTHRTDLGISVDGRAVYIGVRCPDSMIIDRDKVARMLNGPVASPVIEAQSSGRAHTVTLGSCSHLTHSANVSRACRPPPG